MTFQSTEFYSLRRCNQQKQKGQKQKVSPVKSINLNGNGHTFRVGDFQLRFDSTIKRGLFYDERIRTLECISFSLKKPFPRKEFDVQGSKLEVIEVLSPVKMTQKIQKLHPFPAIRSDVIFLDVCGTHYAIIFAFVKGLCTPNAICTKRKLLSNNKHSSFSNIYCLNIL